jgi:hypothetical protein
MNHLDDDAQTRHDGSCGNPNHSASGLDSVFGPRRPMFRSAIGGIPRHGTGIGGVQRSALVSIGRGTGVGGESRIAWRSIGRGTGISGLSRIAGVFMPQRTGISGVSRVARRSIARGTRVGGVPRVAWVSIARRTGVAGLSRVAWVSIARLCVTRIPVSRRSVGWVAVVGARWRWRCTSVPYLK